MVTDMTWNKGTKAASRLALAATAVLVGSMMIGSPALAAEVTIQINDGNVPTKAGGAGTISCDNVPAGDIGDDQDGWVFVLPDSAGAEGNFISVTATFEDENGDEQVYTTGANGGIVSGSGDNKAYIITPAGWTLTAAEAQVTDPDEGAFFNLTHACPGKPGDSPTTPGGGTTPPGDGTTAPGSSTAPGDQSSSANGLPTTGDSNGLMLGLGLVLAAGGVVLVMFLRRRAQADS
jgi:LPXTG-motif cell wall-anchored protein